MTDETADKLRELVGRLLEKTKKSQLRWSETIIDNAFQTSFPNYTVELASENDLIVMRIYNSEGKIISSIDQNTIEPFYNKELGNQVNTEIMKDLYKLARLNAFDADKALDDILASLA